MSGTPEAGPFALLWRHHALLRRLAWREIAGRYRGSFLGALWSLVAPLSLLAIFYTFDRDHGDSNTVDARGRLQQSKRPNIRLHHGRQIRFAIP